MADIEETKDSNFQYVNVAIANPASATTPILCQMQASFATPFLGNSSKYKGSIVRFSLPIDALPYFQCAPLTTPKIGFDTADQIIAGNTITTLNVFNGGHSFPWPLAAGTQLYIQNAQNNAVYGPITLSAIAQPGASQLQLQSWTPPAGANIQAGAGLVLLFPTPYQVTLTYGGVDYGAYVNLIQLDNTYNVYYPSQWIDSVNIALQLANTAVVAANSSITQLQTPPQLSFDSTTNLITLKTPVYTWENTAYNSPAIYMNTPLAALFSQMPQTFLDTNSSSGKDAQFRILLRPAWTATLTADIQGVALGYQVQVATLSSPLTAGTPTTLLSCGGTNIQLGPGQALMLRDSASGQQQVEILTPAMNIIASGTTMLHTQVFTPAFSFPATTTGIFIYNVPYVAINVPGFLPAGSNILVTQWNNRTIFTTATDALPGDPFIQCIPSYIPYGASFGVGVATCAPCGNSGMVSTTDDGAPSVVSWWNTVSIACTTNLLPARGEVIPSNDPSQYSVQNILTDFHITPEERLGGNNTLLYLPTAEYRWFDLTEQDTLSQLDLQFFATDATGLRQNWKPITLQPGQFATAKILFAHKCVTDKKMKMLGGGAKRRRLL